MRTTRFLLCALIFLGIDASAHAATVGLDASALPPDDALVRLVWEHSPELAEARGLLGQARAEVQQTHLLPNPELGLSVGTLAVGTTNPPGLRVPGDTANYNVSLGTLVELGKRGPRQRAAAAGFDATRLSATELLRLRYLDLLRAVAQMAAAQLRLAALTELVADAERLTQLQRARADHGESAGLEAARAELEEESLRSLLAQEQARLHEAVLACTQVAGVSCAPPSERDRAEAVLDRLRGIEVKDDALAERPDLKALEAARSAAQARLDLARAHAIPDPTVVVGYTEDRNVIAGNQPHAFSVGVSVPLPVFDHGQAAARAASADRTAAETRRDQLLGRARRDLDLLRAQLADVARRRERLESQALPLARSVVDRMEKAVHERGAPLSELLLARRSLGELTLDLADVTLRELDLRDALARVAGTGPRSLPNSLD